MHLGRPRHKPLSSRLRRFLGRNRFAGTEGTRGNEYGSFSTWEERGDDSTCVRVDPDGSVILAWVAGFAFARVILQSVKFATAFAQVEPSVFDSVIDERRFALSGWFSLLVLSPQPSSPLPSATTKDTRLALCDSHNLLPLPISFSALV